MESNPSSSTLKDAVAYLNGIVYTVNESQPWAEAFIVSSKGTFTAVGSSKEIQLQAKKEGLVIYDLRGQFIMPGIHDAHVHLGWAGLALLGGVQLDMDVTVENLAERMAQGSCSCAYAHTFGDWVEGNHFALPGFDRACLDERFPDTPVYIRAGAGHKMYTNTAALQGAGYEITNEPDAQATKFVRRQDGSLTGELMETAMDKIALALPKPALSHLKRAVRTAVKQAHSVGVTSLQEAGTNAGLLCALSELDKDSRLDIDVYAHVVEAPAYLAGDARKKMQDLIDVADDFKSTHVHTGFVKFIFDGVPLPDMLTHCELDEGGKADRSKLTVLDLDERIMEHDAKGRTVKVHCTGRGSVRATLDAFEGARKRNPHGAKHEVAHCNAIHPDDYARFKQLNVTAEMSPSLFFAHPLQIHSIGLMEWDFNTFVEHGAHVTIGSDWGGTFPISLLPNLARIVEQVGGGSKERGGALLCRMMTLAGAEAVSMEKEFGSIEVGKRANFIAVSGNLAKGEFEGAKVLRTWFEGEIVWEEGNSQ